MKKKRNEGYIENERARRLSSPLKAPDSIETRWFDLKLPNDGKE